MYLLALQGAFESYRLIRRSVYEQWFEAPSRIRTK